MSFPNTESLEELREELAQVSRFKNILETVLDTAYEGIVVIDEHNTITMFNQAYGDFLGVEPAEMIGKDVRDAIENTRMHEVVRSGVAELRQVQRIKDHDMFCDRVPIREGGRVVGAVGKVLFRDVSELEGILQQAQKLRNELEFYKDELRRRNGTRYSLDSIVGRSPQMQQLRKLAVQVARGSSTVLLGGESGTGKELFAHAIHNLSSRASEPFIKVNCAALPEPLLESELFGYREGAFTGAKRGGKIGKFEMANGGTILLDEIGELSLAMQVKLLRVLQEKELERLGGNRVTAVDVRVIAATNRDLLAMVETRRFRADLYYRLNVISLDVPPLRERHEDLPDLVEHFVAKHCQAMGCEEKQVTQEAMHKIRSYQWPGNARELENALERAITLCEGEIIQPVHLPVLVRTAAGTAGGFPTLRQVLEATEAEQIRQAIVAAGGNVVRAAALLGIGKTRMYEKIAKYGIPKRTISTSQLPE